MSAVILDASALLALLRGEAGGKKVEGALGDARMSVVNMAEVASHYSKLGMPDDMVTAMLRPLPIKLIDADAGLCWEAGRLRGLTIEAGLSLGDRFCLALAKREKLPAWTADRKWRDIADAAGVKVVAIR
ncbi:twitching motility protein PilT [Sphingomonas sp. Leaf24]|uniref:type II toxin-antitoxin system VapC family toxin n=1 Tax=unclassified Sphingomonas TaxID=196159 RepID=UPI0006F313CB|nr:MULTISPECIES: type II toxin-antitoxin system VapC family toxin [unclassified Sphingomonas]KQM21429.1 twitching motility protein PilT [Sphingomonas sp. Leaf5]KQM93546.1 twitching motility protein PilT [Sphingomonas sp. Leaf24]